MGVTNVDGCFEREGDCVEKGIHYVWGLIHARYKAFTKPCVCWVGYSGTFPTVKFDNNGKLELYQQIVGIPAALIKNKIHKIL